MSITKDQLVNFVVIVKAFIIIILGLFIAIGYSCSLKIVAGNSMLPTIKDGDIVIVKKVLLLRQLKRDDLIAFRLNDQIVGLKRIFAVQGDTLVLERIIGVKKKGIITSIKNISSRPIKTISLCNNEYLKYIEQSINKNMDVLEAETINVPKRFFFVIGDNLNLSIDSRTLGFISFKKIF